VKHSGQKGKKLKVYLTFPGAGGVLEAGGPGAFEDFGDFKDFKDSPRVGGGP
jgi:hypothetical protein